MQQCFSLLHFYGVKNQYVEKRVHPKDREMMQKAISLETITKKLQEDREYKGNYLVVEDGEPG